MIDKELEQHNSSNLIPSLYADNKQLFFGSGSSLPAGVFNSYSTPPTVADTISASAGDKING